MPNHARRGQGCALLLTVLGVATMIVLLATAAAAQAADRIYWANSGADTVVSFANLDGSGGGGSLDLTGATPTNTTGLALYPSGNKIFWGSPGFVISFANLDGTGGAADLNLGGNVASSSQGVAVDPGSGRLYWPNSFMSQGIFFTRLDNSGGGGQVNTTGATVVSPIGVAVDPSAGRIYWANPFPAQKISFANLDGSGGGDINTTGATVNNPQGVAIDPAAGRIYWTNVSGQKISFANLDGSGGGDLNTTGATVSNPAGVAIDHAAGKIYWASVAGQKVSFARLDNSGGGDLATTGATVNFPNFAVILKGPTGIAVPEVTRMAGALSCSQGGWSADQVESFLYRAPSSFAYQWSQDGADVPGATGAGFTPGAAGHYRCTVTASNPAGSASQATDPFAFFTIGKARRNPRRGTARLPITIPDPGRLTLTGSGVRTQVVNPPAAGTTTLVVKTRGRKRRRLNRNGRVGLALSVAYAPNGLAPSSETTQVRLRKL